MAPSATDKSRTLQRLAREARPYWPHLFLLLGLNFVSALLALLTPVPLKLIVDSTLGGHELPGIVRAVFPATWGSGDLITIAAIASSIIVIALLRKCSEMGSGVLQTWVVQKLLLRFRARLFRHAQRLSLAYHDSKGAADSAYRIQYDAPAVHWVLVDTLIPLATSSLTLVAMFFIMMNIDWQLAAIAIVVVPILYGTAKFFSRRLRRHWLAAKSIESAAHSVINEVLNAVRVVKIFSAEDREQRRFEERAGRSLREQIRLSLLTSRFSMIIGLTIAIGTAGVLFVGARHVQAGILTIGDLVLVMSYLAQLYAPLETLTRSSGSLQGSLASADRAFAILDEKPEVIEHANPRPLAKARGTIQFENVSFAYSAERPVLHNISCDIPAGGHVGIAGHTGAGKSTLISLLLRLYDPTEGRVMLDGVDLREYSLRDLRNQFAMVLQDPVLFAASIGDNIAYARPEATPQEIEAAARAANIHQFIAGLNQGYDTPVGERGFQLSGGERQRVSLARAFLRDAPILILDEPTSSVDVKTESEIMDGLERLMRGRTTFMIAHRLTTLDLCSIRMEMDHGRLTRFENALEQSPASRS